MMKKLIAIVTAAMINISMFVMPAAAAQPAMTGTLKNGKLTMQFSGLDSAVNKVSFTAVSKGDSTDCVSGSAQAVSNSATGSVTVKGTDYVVSAMPKDADGNELAALTPIEVKDSTPGVAYSIRLINGKWQTAVSNGATAGSTAQKSGIDGIQIALDKNAPEGALVTYQAYIQKIGWQKAVSDGTGVGITGKNIEALKFTLKGMDDYEIEYRVYQNTSWTDWVITENGTDILSAGQSGVTGKSAPIKATEIKVVKKVTIEVSSVEIATTSSIAVTFNIAPEDIKKVIFYVTDKSGDEVAEKTTWNKDSTVATLTAGSKFPSKTYAVSVKYKSSNLVTSTVTFTDEKVAKIEITSKTLELSTISSVAYGFATYKVYNQYGNDITETNLGNHLNWVTSVGAIVENGNTADITDTGFGTVLIKSLSSDFPLSVYKTCTLYAYNKDVSVSVSASATLNISQAANVLKSITLNKLTGSNGDTLSTDSTGIFYLDFTADDMGGAETKNYTLLKYGIRRIIVGNYLSPVTLDNSNGVMRDIDDMHKAAIAFTVNTDKTKSLVADTDITIFLILSNGTVSTLTVTMKKISAIQSFTLTAPTQDVAAGESMALTFSAIDESGVKVTQYSKIKPFVEISGAKLCAKADGTAYIKFTAGDTECKQLVLAYIIQSGKMDSIIISVNKAVKVETLTVDSSINKPMLIGATLQYSCGNGFKVTDQYGRAYDMTTTAGQNYEIVAVDQSKAISFNQNGSAGTANYAKGTSAITITAAAENVNAKVVFELVSSSVASAYASDYSQIPETSIIDSKTVIFSVLSPSSIVKYTLSGTYSTLYAQAAATVSDPSKRTGLDEDYSVAATLYGITSDSKKVVLGPSYKGNPYIYQVSLSNSTDFYACNNDTAISPQIGIYAKAYSGSSQSTATTTIMASISGADGNIYTATISANSSNALPVVKSIYYHSDTIDSITGEPSISLADLTADPIKYNVGLSHSNTAVIHGRPFYVYGVDNYGVKVVLDDIKFGTCNYQDSSGNSVTGDTSYDPFTGLISFPDDTATGTITFTVYSNNGVFTTVTLIVD